MGKRKLSKKVANKTFTFLPLCKVTLLFIHTDFQCDHCFIKGTIRMNEFLKFIVPTVKATTLWKFNGILQLSLGFLYCGVADPLSNIWGGT
jgi:hypothetical protein